MGFIGWMKQWLQESDLGNKPTLDLYRLSVKAALEEIRNFIEKSYWMGFPSVRLICGKGPGSPGDRGVLREVIPKWCEQEGKAFIESSQREIDPAGGDGAWIFILKKPPAP
jgi:DNA-nicking Smr family endonuclease